MTTDTDLLLNVPESSGPELEMARREMETALAEYQTILAGPKPEHIRRIQCARDRLAQLEAEAMRKEAR